MAPNDYEDELEDEEDEEEEEEEEEESAPKKRRQKKWKASSRLFVLFRCLSLLPGLFPLVYPLN
jgi:hypothetical protein